MNDLLCKLKPCPFCGAAGELRPGSEIEPTLDQALQAEKSARCSGQGCGARFIYMSVTEWNTRADEDLIETEQADEERPYKRNRKEIMKDEGVSVGLAAAIQASERNRR